MFQLVVAASIALGSEAIDGIFKKSGSCSGGSCSAAAPAQVVESKPVAKEKATKTDATSCSSCGSGKVRNKIGGIFKRCR